MQQQKPVSLPVALRLCKNIHPMSLMNYKWVTAGIITIVTFFTGFASLHFIKRYQRLLQIGDTFADGIFLGAAAFHLFPNAIRGLLLRFSALYALLFAFLFAACGFLLLFFLERWLMRREAEHLSTTTAGTWILAGVLSVHALIAGAALGISDTVMSISVLFIAILAHKGFESFALAMSLHRRWQHEIQPKVILFCFSFMTPIGIVLASLIGNSLQNVSADFLTSIFSAFAAGTFFYIGTLHATHNHFDPRVDPTSRYYKLLATFAGIGVMGVLAVWM